MASIILTSLTLLAIVAAIIGVPWYLGRRFARMEMGQNELRKISNGLLGLVGLVIGFLHKRQTLSDDELHAVLSSYAELARIPKGDGNPLMQEEQMRLNTYLTKVRRGDFFLPEEVEDYNALVLRLEEKRKGDPGVWPLVALGAFLLGLFLASRK